MGHSICRPEASSLHLMCWSQWGQENLNSLIGLWPEFKRRMHCSLAGRKPRDWGCEELTVTSRGGVLVHHGIPGDANGKGPFRPARSRDGSKVSTVAPTGTTRLADAHATPSHNAPPAGTGCSPRLATSAVSAFGTVMVPGGACPPARLRPVVPGHHGPSSQQGRHRPGTAPVALPWGATPMGALPERHRTPPGPAPSRVRRWCRT